MIDLSLYRNENECCDYFQDKRKICVHEENGMKYELENSGRAQVTKFLPTNILAKKDGATKSCDALFIVELISGGKKAFLVELKNPDIIKATRQLDQTLQTFVIKRNSFDNVYGRIIPRATFAPNLYHTEYIRLKIKFEGLKGDLKTKNKYLKDII